MFSTGQRGEFKASYKLFEREDGNLMVCWKLEGCKAFGFWTGLGLAGKEF